MLTAEDKKAAEYYFMRPMKKNVSSYEEWITGPSYDEEYTRPIDSGWITTTAPSTLTPEQLEKMFRPPAPYPADMLKALDGSYEMAKKAFYSSPPVHVDDYLIDLAVEPSQIVKLFFKVWKEAEKCGGYKAGDWYELAALLKLGDCEL